MIDEHIGALNSPVYFVAVCSDMADAKNQAGITSVYLDIHDDMMQAQTKDLEEARLELRRSNWIIAWMQTRKIWQLRMNLVRLRNTFFHLG